MIKWAFRILVFSALGALMLPGNEVHRDQAFRSVMAAYANAAVYCENHAPSCDSLMEKFSETRVALARYAREAGTDLTKSIMKSSVMDGRPAAQPVKRLEYR